MKRFILLLKTAEGDKTANLQADEFHLQLMLSAASIAWKENATQAALLDENKKVVWRQKVVQSIV